MQSRWNTVVEWKSNFHVIISTCAWGLTKTKRKCRTQWNLHNETSLVVWWQSAFLYVLVNTQQLSKCYIPSANRLHATTFQVKTNCIEFGHTAQCSPHNSNSLNTNFRLLWINCHFPTIIIHCEKKHLFRSIHWNLNLSIRKYLECAVQISVHVQCHKHDRDVRLYYVLTVWTGICH